MDQPTVVPRSQRALRVAAGVMLVVVATGVIRVAPVYATTDLGIFHDLVASASSLTLCTGVKKTVHVAAEAVHYVQHENGSLEGDVLGRAAGVPVNAFSGNSEFVAVTPTTAVTPTRRQSRTSRLAFVLEAKEPGSTAVLFTPGSPRGNPVSIGVRVAECAFQLYLHSVWRWRKNPFHPILTSRSEAHLNVDRDGNFEVGALVTNSAIGAPNQGCSPTYTVGGSTVSIHGSVQDRFGHIRAITTFEWTTVRAETHLICADGVEAPSIGTAQIQKLTVPLPLERTSRSYRHILDVGARVIGTTQIIIVPIRT